ncbi:hypothetical protein B296_00026435 [Ensete ventricosum]|uniref:Uncharacterized protein n=1 Tax=Ensete ventricosum TaxID=4639 RepID=A0A426Z7X4_ENSVE|nr:hypothetical protein B296_00026435 [Ensete ventricosum]
MSSASSHFESHSVKVSAHRSRALSRPSGDFRSIAIISSSGGATLADLGAADAFTAMRSYFNVNSTVTTHRLVEVRKNYFVPSEYELHAPLLGEHPYDTCPSGFNLSTDTLEVGLRFPLHPVIEACLKGWQISPSYMVGHSGNPRVVHGLFLANSGASRVLPDCSQWTPSEVHLPATKAGSRAFSSSLVIKAGASRPSGHLGWWTTWSRCFRPMRPNRPMFFQFAYYAEFFLIVHYHVEMFNLGKIKSDDETGSGSTILSTTSTSATIGVAGSMIKKCPSIGEEAGLRKHIRKTTFEQPGDVLGSTMRSPTKKGKGVGGD